MRDIIEKIIKSILVIWIIASKDIIDAIKNKLLLAMLASMSFMLLMPRMMGLMLAPPQINIAVYDPDSSYLTNELEASSKFRVIQVQSLADFNQVLETQGSGLGTEIGIAIPGDFDEVLETGGDLSIQGYMSWANRFKAPALIAELEEQLASLLGQPIHIGSEGNLVYPPDDGGLMLGIATISVVIIILMIGINLVPQLIIEEKRTRTMAALLVSPASITHVVVGKALAGYFYVLTACGLVFALYWSGVVHWETAILFAMGSGFFSVGAGLFLGSFFDRQQEIIGWVSIILVLLTGAMFITMLNLDVPPFIQATIQWLPSVALGYVFQSTFFETVAWSQIWRNLVSVGLISFALYTLTIWKVARMDR